MKPYEDNNDRDWFIVLLCCVAGFFFALTMLSIFL
jgi:hypothetical protein